MNALKNVFNWPSEPVVSIGNKCPPVIKSPELPFTIIASLEIEPKLLNLLSAE